MTVREIATRPYADQKPGTAGLRKKVAVFQQPHYLENFLQSIFDLEAGLRDATLVIGGDGRYHNRAAIGTAIAMAAANGVRRVIVGRGGLLSTPAASHLIRHRDAAGGFIFTASHNPAGADGDFGIKYNVAGGGQASEGLTDRIHRQSLQIQRYLIDDGTPPDLDRLGEQSCGNLLVEVVDPVDDYAALMQTLFDFDRIRAWLAGGARIRFDALHAVTGPYARRILVEQLGAPEDSLRNAQPLEDFGGGHPDPNLVYAKSLVDLMMAVDAPDFGAASDGDGDRNMILGRGVFVSPGDSLALLAAHADRLPGYRGRMRGVARSMPTSRAVDAVAAAAGIECHETPTGWKFFCNLLDAGRVTLCGEESFGTGSDHLREKDGLWAALAWMNLLAASGQSVDALMRAHWQRFGRHYYQRHDYEDLDPAQAKAIQQRLRDRAPQLVGQPFGDLTVSLADEFAYHDPIDGSDASGQGLRVVFGDQARIILRASGTGTGGVTLRLYLERHRQAPAALDAPPASALAALAQLAEELCGIAAISGRRAPSLVT